MSAINGALADWMSKNKAYSIQGSLPFELGKSYPRRDGKMVKIIAVNNTPYYETVQGDDGVAGHLGFRYNRPGDRGRCTGTASDFSDPLNLLPNFEPSASNTGEGFFVPVSLMGANKPERVRKLFGQLLTLEREATDIRYSCLGKNPAWEGAFRQLFDGPCSVRSRVSQVMTELGFGFDWQAKVDAKVRDGVRDYTWALTEFLEDKRPFYAA
jgi:hypothetical protein